MHLYCMCTGVKYTLSDFEVSMKSNNSNGSTPVFETKRYAPRVKWQIITANDRSFKIGIIVLVVLMLGVMAGLNLYLFSKAHNFFFDSLETSNTEGSLTMILALSDNVDEVFRQHWADLIQPLPHEKTEPALRERLNQVASLPGVDRAFLLSVPDNLMVTQGDVSPALRDTLAERRNIFKGYHLGGLKHPRKFHHWLFNQIRFENITRSPGDTLRMIFAAFDSNGKAFRVVPEKKFQPEMVNNLIALQMDEGWIKSSLAAAMDTLFYDRQIFALWSLADPQKGPETNGAGVLGFGDTLWWAGLKDVEAKSKAEGLISDWPFPSSPWFSFRTVVNAGDLQYIGQKPHRIFVMVLALADLGLLIIGHLLVTWLFVLRRQWLNQQIALGHLAHSVKTPVARLQLAANILEDGQVSSPDEERKVIQTVSEECRHLRRAVENAALSMEGSKITVHKAQGDLAVVMRETVTTWQPSFDQNGIRLVTEGLDNVVQCAFEVDKMRLLLDNMIDNALRHSYLNLKDNPDKPAIVSVNLSKSDNHVSFSVTDSGAGISKNVRNNLFKPMLRRSQDPLTGVSGLGLGLALVKEIAEAHNGKVSVEDTPTGGARFVVTIPI